MNKPARADDRAQDLARLNEPERRVLLLLAEGHTAKSIAMSLDSTEAAVNERLREARRKTGVGSSRELARLLKAQENRDEQKGVGKARALAASAAEGGADPWRPQTGVFAMMAFLVIAAAGAAALMSQAPPQLNEVDPLIGTPLETAPDPAALHARVRAQPRDASWAAKMEGSVRARLLKIPLIGKDGNVLRVTCATDLCEIGGTVVSPPKAEWEDQQSQFSRTIKDLQVPPLTEDLGKLGLKSETGLFTSGKGKPDRTVFLLYYSRAK